MLINFFFFSDGTYFIEVDRLLRPGGYFVVSGPPVQWLEEDKECADLLPLKQIHTVGFEESHITSILLAQSWELHRYVM